MNPVSYDWFWIRLVDIIDPTDIFDKYCWSDKNKLTHKNIVKIT